MEDEVDSLMRHDSLQVITPPLPEEPSPILGSTCQLAAPVDHFPTHVFAFVSTWLLVHTKPSTSVCRWLHTDKVCGAAALCRSFKSPTLPN